LEFAGMKSLDELPASDVLSSRQIDEWLKNATNPATPTDTDMGLADEQLPLEAVVAAEAAASAPAVAETPAVETSVEATPVAVEEAPAAPKPDEPTASA
jgi:segregation and condensation protein B